MKTESTTITILKSFFIKAGIFCCICIAIAAVLFFLRKGPSNNTAFKRGPKVKISYENGRYQLRKDGKNFLIKGGAGYSFIKELALKGGNTIFCWDTAKIAATLEESSHYHIAVIIGLDLPADPYFDIYQDEKKVKDLSVAYQHIILRYKDNPAILAWCLGNELNFPFSVQYDPFYHAFNQLLAMMHQTDPDHPVCTTVINIGKRNLFNIMWRIPALDFVGINIYNSIRNIRPDMDFIKSFWKGPYFISEWAPRGGWEAPVTSWQAPFEKNSTQKAQEYYDFYSRYMPLTDPRFLGSLAFYWGSRHEYTHTFYSVFNEDGTPTEISEALSDCWKESRTEHKSPSLTNMLVDDTAASRDNILFNAGSSHTARIELKQAGLPERLRYSWEVVKDNWSSWGKTWVRFEKPAAEMNLIADSSQPNIILKAPLKEGPYRIFVTVYNEKGYCATANAPFYVIE